MNVNGILENYDPVEDNLQMKIFFPLPVFKIGAENSQCPANIFSPCFYDLTKKKWLRALL